MGKEQELLDAADMVIDWWHEWHDAPAGPEETAAFQALEDAVAARRSSSDEAEVVGERDDWQDRLGDAIGAQTVRRASSSGVKAGVTEAIEACAKIAASEYNEMWRLAHIHDLSGAFDSRDRCNAAARAVSRVEAAIRALGVRDEGMGEGWYRANPQTQTASCPSCRGTGDTGGNPSYGVCDDCNGTGKVQVPTPIQGDAT